MTSLNVKNTVLTGLANEGGSRLDDRSRESSADARVFVSQKHVKAFEPSHVQGQAAYQAHSLPLNSSSDKGQTMQQAVRLMLVVMLLVSAAIGGCTSLNDQREVRQREVLHVHVQGDRVPWTHLNTQNNPKHFQFAIVTDRTGGRRPGVFEDAVRKLNLLQPEFVVSVGDLINGYTKNRAELDRQWDEFDGFVRQLEMPFFYLPGNHDYTNAVMARKWKERYGPPHFHFVYEDVLFLCLNTEDALGAHKFAKIHEPQYRYAERVLREHRDVRWTLVFMHQPLWTKQDTGWWPKLEQLLAKRRHTVFAGHYHRYRKHVRNDQRYFVLATTGGGSGLLGPAFGQFDHVVWVTMTDDGPLIANLMLDGIWDDDPPSLKMAASPRAMLHWSPIQAELTRIKDGRGVTRIRLVNHASVNMRARGTLRTHAFLKPDRSIIDTTVPPNGIEDLTLSISTTASELPSRIPPLVVDWKISFQRPHAPDLKITWSRYRMRVTAGG